mmetsp:Transcript_122414/g.346054  ORF Transcript_122414/g.346054 Transcript_122414/m.346054 type:complete len:96 (+) Transcript_122414:144-431(+)
MRGPLNRILRHLPNQRSNGSSGILVDNDSPIESNGPLSFSSFHGREANTDAFRRGSTFLRSETTAPEAAAMPCERSGMVGCDSMGTTTQSSPRKE